MKNTLTKIIAGTALISGLAGCDLRDSSNDFKVKDTANGYEFTALHNENGKTVVVTKIPVTTRLPSTVYAEGLFENFELIKSSRIPKGNPMEAYMNLDSINDIYDRLAPKKTQRSKK